MVPAKSIILNHPYVPLSCYSLPLEEAEYQQMNESRGVLTTKQRRKTQQEAVVSQHQRSAGPIAANFHHTRWQDHYEGQA
ncbi:hypothetical protein TNCT_703321 [Trichonephila clavata]|uniref:Uncharacterized protein n=1 Tax=Trichonephila clavata TaxID=2740835 RepID=A0A8X6KTX0_TRICU|nr:hypothetical protein TNCT_703321 [Trichonephila clavata]